MGGNGGNPKKAESHLRRSESTQGAPGVQGGLFGVQEGAVGSQEVAGKWRCMNDFSQKVEDFSRFFEIGSFRPWRRRRWSRLAERSPKPVFPLRTDHRKWVSLKTRKIRRFSRRTPRPGYWPVTPPGCDSASRQLGQLPRGGTPVQPRVLSPANLRTHSPASRSTLQSIPGHQEPFQWRTAPMLPGPRGLCFFVAFHCAGRPMASPH